VKQAFELKNLVQDILNEAKKQGATAAEVALSIEVGIKERLSIQHFNSNTRELGTEPCYPGSWTLFKSVIDYVGKFVPWANEGADFADYYRDGGVKPSDISEEVYYPVIQLIQHWLLYRPVGFLQKLLHDLQVQTY